MAIEFYEKEITRTEEWNKSPYIGYFSPEGNLIDYNIMFGNPGHDEWRNPVSATFVAFASYIIKNTSIKKYKDSDSIYQAEEYPGLDEEVIHGYNYWCDMNENTLDEFIQNLYNYSNRFQKNGDEYNKFRYDLLKFFERAYSDKNFFDTVGKFIYVENKKTIEEYVDNHFEQKLNWKEKEEIYREYVAEEIMKYFKDIAVQYLGYDSLERFKPNGQAIIIPEYYDEVKFDFLKNPRIITSAYPNINERYYNYLLMNWTVHRVPKYVFNEKTKRFEIDHFLSTYESEKEGILDKEIQAVKRLVPIKERYKYFR